MTAVPPPVPPEKSAAELLAEIERLRGDHEPMTYMSLAEWEDWSNEVASALPEQYDGDEAQESIILEAVRDMAEQLADRDRAVEAARRAALNEAAAAIREVAAEWANIDPYDPAPDALADALRVVTDLRDATAPPRAPAASDEEIR